MAGEGRLSEGRVKRRYLGWIGKVDRRRKGTKTRRSGETRRNASVWEENAWWKILKGRLLLTGRVLGAILWRWRRTGPKAVLKNTRRTGPSELSTDIAGTAILDYLVVHPLVHYGGD